MGKVFFSVTMSLDGYIAPQGMDLGNVDAPDFDKVMQEWSALQDWVGHQAFFLKNLGLAGDGETGVDNQLLEDTFNRTGVSILGKRMFDGGERYWPEEAPFHTPVFVVTHQEREPWVRPGGTTFYFVNDGIESALRQAQEVVGDRDIRVAGGADLIQQYLNAGLVDEFHIALAPILLGGGRSLFAGVDRHRVMFEITEAINSPHATHLMYAVKGRS